MIEVAIASVEAVFDWEAFIAKDGKKSKKNDKNKNTEVVKEKQPEVKAVAA